MNKLLVICGPTATGKTSLAVKLAKKFNGELISADSRQVYKEMDIGTGKDHPKGIKIHLVDVIKPNQEFSVSQYYHLVWQAIRKIWSKGKLPILVGGSGFYIKAVVDGIETLGIPPDWELRKKLSNLDIKKLRKILEKTCPERMRGMNESDRNNPRRLIRAIEVASKQHTTYNMQPRRETDALFIGLTAPYKTLYQRIDKRVDERVKIGQEVEIKKLLKKDYSWGKSVLGVTIGYKEWKPFFEGEATKDEVIQKWKFAEHAYARRQMTWFKKALRQAQGVWFDINKKGWKKGVEKLIKNWYTRTDDKEN